MRQQTPSISTEADTASHRRRRAPPNERAMGCSADAGRCSAGRRLLSVGWVTYVIFSTMLIDTSLKYCDVPSFDDDLRAVIVKFARMTSPSCKFIDSACLACSPNIDALIVPISVRTTSSFISNVSCLCCAVVYSAVRIGNISITIAIIVLCVILVR